MTDTEREIQGLLLAVTGLEKVQEGQSLSIEKQSLSIEKLALSIEKLAPINEKLHSIETIINKEIKNIENRVDSLEDEQKQGISPTVTKWILGLIITYAITFGTWVTSQLSKVDYATIDNKNQITYLKGRLKAQNE